MKAGVLRKLLFGAIAGVVVLAAVALWWVGAVRGPAEGSPYQTIQNNYEAEIERLMAASALPEEELLSRWRVLHALLGDAGRVLRDAEATLNAVIDPADRLGSVRGHWRVDEAALLSNYLSVPVVQLEMYEATNEVLLEWARASGLMDRLLAPGAYAGVVGDPAVAFHDPSLVMSSGALNASQLLRLEFADRAREGDWARAAAALDAIEGLAGTLAAQIDGIALVYARILLQERRTVVLDAIELGLMTPEFATVILASEPKIEYRVWRRRAPVADILTAPFDLVFWMDPHEDSGYAPYGREDGRIRLALAIRSVFGSFPMLIGQSRPELQTVPGATPWRRHATFSEFAEACLSHARRVSDAIAPPLRERRPDALSGVRAEHDGALRYIGPIDGLYNILERQIERIDHAEFADAGLRIVLAIEVYRAEHGGVPVGLEDLVPGVLAGLPVNPLRADGRFLYRADPGSAFGYALYTDPAEGDPDPPMDADGGVLPDPQRVIVPRAEG